MTVTFITRWFTVLAVLLLVAVAPVRKATADALPQAAHPTSQAAPEAKIGSAAHIQPLRPGFQFPYGQTFHYEGEWRFWTAGLATLRVDHAGAQDHVTATADSNGVVAMLYRVQDRFNSYFDSKTLCTTKLIKHAEEGSHRRDTTITYDYSRGKAVLEEKNLKDNTQKRTENDIPSCVDRKSVV